VFAAAGWFAEGRPSSWSPFDPEAPPGAHAASAMRTASSMAAIQEIRFALSWLTVVSFLWDNYFSTRTYNRPDTLEDG